MQYIFLSHDVDWRKQGPLHEHLLARKDRFEPEIFQNTNLEKLYYNFPEFMEIEEKLDVRSTFFFRTKYENGNYLDYEDEIKSLVNGGWEIGLHTDPSSVSEIDKIKDEKNRLETLSKTKIVGNRVHYLSNDDDLLRKLSSLNFIYDSSKKNSKYDLVQNDFGYNKFEKIIQFPITVMDTYLFTYMKMTEEKIIPLFDKTLNLSRKLNSEFNVMTILWHDNVLKMKGGRMYPKLLEFLVSQDDVVMLKGVDIASLLNQHTN